MAAANSTPIQLYYSNTPGSKPANTSLIIGELAINVPDGIVFYNDSTNNVNIIARTSAAAGRFPNVTFTSDGTTQHTAAMPWGISNNIWNQANTSTLNIEIIQGVNLEQNTSIIAAGSYANSAYGKSNTVGSYANSAFSKANTAFNDATGASNYANGAFAKANTNTTDIQVLYGIENTQNTDISYATTLAQQAFDYANTLSGGTASDGVARSIAQGAFDKANSAYSLASTDATNISVLQGVNATQNTDIIAASGTATAAFIKANGASEIAQGAFDAANNAYNAGGVIAGGYANSAFAKANAAVANTTTITIAGNLNVPGQANVHQRLSVGTGAYQVLPNLIAQFTGFSDYYSQVNQQNLSANGTGDFVITADNGTDATNYMDVGMAGSNYDNTTPNAFGMVNPNDGYVMLVGDPGSSVGGNLYIGTSGSGPFADISVVQGNDYIETARFVNGQGLTIKTGTSSTDKTTGALVVTGGIGASGTINADKVFDTSGDLRVLGQSAFNQANGAFTKANNSLSVTGGTVGYANVTANVTVGTYLDVLPSSTPTVTEGRIWYNNTEHTLKQGTETGSIIDLGRQTTIRVKNESGVSIPKGAAVRVLGGEATDTPKIGLAKANSYPWIDGLIGASNETIANNSYGYVVTSGPIVGVDTSMVQSGKVVYVSNTTEGAYTQNDVGPADGYAVHLGSCIVSDAIDGVILISQKGIEWGANFTNGAIAYSNGYRLYEDPTNFYWDHVNKRLGVGTNTPTANLHVQGTAYISGDVTITGNLTAANIVSVSTQELTVSGNTIYLNDGAAGAPVYNASIMVVRGTSPNTYLRWNEEVDEWVIFDGTSEGHILDSTRTFQDWETYRTSVAYEKAAYPIGADLANATNELAKSASTTASAGLAIASSASNYANGAFTKANTVASDLTTNVNYFQGVDNTQNTSISSALEIAQGAFDKANTGGVRTITVANSNRLTQNTNHGDVRLDLATTTVIAGTYSYPYLVVDAYGRLTSISNQTPVTTITYGGSTYSGDVTISATDIADILGYTPVNGTTYFNDQVALAGVNNRQNTNTIVVGNYANAAFGAANASMIQANNAWTTANGISDAALSAGTYANAALELATTVSYYANASVEMAVAAGSYANSAYGKVNSAFSFANTVNGTVTSAFIKANTAFNNAAAGSDYANAAFGVANTAYVGMIDAGSYANAAFEAANNAMIAGGQVSGAYANAAFGTANASFAFANTVNGTVTSAFIKANTAFNDATGASNYANGAFATANTAYDSSLVANANASGASNYANGAFTKANSAFNNAAAGSAYANAAFAKANTALANTSGATFGGDLHISGNVDVISISFPDGTRQYTSPEATASYANSAFNTANTVGVYANTGINIAQGAFDAANNAYVAGGVVAGGYANSAFAVANLAYTGMVAAGSYANTAFGLVNAAFEAANTAYTAGGVVAGGYANAAFGVANAGFEAASSAGNYANSAFLQANSAWTLANDAYAYANTLVTGGSSVDNTARENAQGAFDKANSAFDVGQGAFDVANTNSTNITALYGIENYQNTYIQLVESNALAASIYANAAFDAANNAYTAGGVVAGAYANAAFEVANAASSYANAAFDKANTNAGDITTVGVYANTAISDSSHSLDIAQRAWNQANTSASFLYTVSSTPPGTPGPSDLWYDTSTDILFQYLTSDGTNYFWIDIDSPTVSSQNTTISYTYTGYGRAAAHAMIFGGF